MTKFSYYNPKIFQKNASKNKVQERFRHWMIINNGNKRQNVLMKLKPASSMQVLAMALLILISGVGAWAAPKEEMILARGDGFVLTQIDVQILKSIVESGAFRASDESHRQTAIRTWLFAAEGESLGLGPNVEPGKKPDPKERVLGKLQTSMRYIKKVLRELPISEDAILAYYRAHPGQPGYETLDEELRTKIRYRMAAVKKMEIMTREIGPLKEKYNFDMVDQDKGGVE
ncbi:MAG: hypothetical protein GY859_17075 [Desulfobacterales bacterium]|nr:hypothetical protein [Desulfobacterales bacterium]